MFQSCNPVDIESAGNLKNVNSTCAKGSSILCQPGSRETDVAHGNLLALATNQKQDAPCHDAPYSVTFLGKVDQPLESRAIDFFFATQVFREPESIRGYYEYLPGFMNKNTINERLSKSLRAVALAVYSFHFHYRDALPTARRYYGQAIKLINGALSSNTEAVEDSTVISILLLGTFENVTSESTRSLRSTKAHMLGVMAVFNVRGYQQFGSRYRLQMFQQMCICLYFACVMYSLYIPAELKRLRTFSARFLDTNDPSWKLSDSMERVAEFRANVQNSSYQDAGRIVEAALHIDGELTSLANDMPNSWLFQTISVGNKSNLVFDTSYHVYPDLWIASTWNNLRTCRLLLHQEILNQLKKFPLFTTSRYIPVNYVSATISQQMIDEICASIPQFCEGLAIHPDHAEALTIPLKNGIPKTAAVYYLMWPIMNMKDSIDSDGQRKWIVNRLRCIGNSAGIRQAFAVAEFLESNRSIVLA
jgi:hypothetical protein